MTELIQQQTKCPKCGSINLRKNGYRSDGRPRFYCKDCKHAFTKNPKPKHPKKLPLVDTAKLLKRHQQIIDISIIENVPCFCCYQTCNPEKCSKLEKWLDE